MIKVGIPRALFYHYYYPLWKAFFNSLGAEVVLSPPTNKTIMDRGIRNAVDEACLPVKLYYGHVISLIDQVDMMFVPRLVSVGQKDYLCPKLMGLPDMLRAGIPNLPPLISPTVDLSRDVSQIQKAIAETGRNFTHNPFRIRRAWGEAQDWYRNYKDLLKQGMLAPEAMEKMEQGTGWFTDVKEIVPERVIGVLGHAYNLYDHHISMGLIPKLRQMKARVITSDNLPWRIVDEEASRLPKRLFWTLGKRMIGGAYHFMSDPVIDGIVCLASFGCGPDSLIGDLTERLVRRTRSMPFLYLSIDEHTGEAGLNTRLEAFMDLVAWRDAR
ncbi:MAG: acyl-CoA dehydratase activase-related protein [Bacillota bacterium]